MRFHKENNLLVNAEAEAGIHLWNPLREPSAGTMSLLAIPVSIIFGYLLYLGWSKSIPNLKDIDILGSYVALKLILGFSVLIFIHEVIHLLCHPRLGASSHSIVGIIPKHLMFYAMFNGEWSCRRFIGCLLAPFLVLSILPLILSYCGAPVPAYWSMISIVNAMAASGDLIAAFLLAKQVPWHASVQNIGWKSYWRVGEEASRA